MGICILLEMLNLSGGDASWRIEGELVGNEVVLYRHEYQGLEVHRFVFPSIDISDHFTASS